MGFKVRVDSTSRVLFSRLREMVLSLKCLRTPLETAAAANINRALPGELEGFPLCIIHNTHHMLATAIAAE